jgi:tRNA threonylcarbamoyladenosine biosynthesis protein TsaE
MSKNITTNSPEETIEVAARIAQQLSPGDFIALKGDLGAGKTVFTKGLAKGLGVKDYRYVNSPTFIILKEYSGDIDLYHFDVYRLDEQSFANTIDYKKYFYGKGITVVEWADKIPDELPEECLEITISLKTSDSRDLRIKAYGKKYENISI